jgi:hypothetical protein
MTVLCPVEKSSIFTLSVRAKGPIWGKKAYRLAEGKTSQRLEKSLAICDGCGWGSGN